MLRHSPQPPPVQAHAFSHWFASSMQKGGAGAHGGGMHPDLPVPGHDERVTNGGAQLPASGIGMMHDGAAPPQHG
jgi:hypothetical protein